MCHTYHVDSYNTSYHATVKKINNNTSLISGGGWTAVLDCISTFVSVIPLDIFKMTSGQFHAIFVVNSTEPKQLPTFIPAIGLQIR